MLRQAFLFYFFLVLSVAIVFGGETFGAFPGDLAAQLLSIPLIIGIAASPPDRIYRRERRFLFWLLGSISALLALQLAPLSLGSLPEWPLSTLGGSLLSAAATPAHVDTVSLTPQQTWNAAASVIVPIAIFCWALRLTFRQRLWTCYLVLALGLLSLVLGFLQLAQGEESPLRFYEITNKSEAVGFFANRNHFAAFLNVTLVLAGLGFELAAQNTRREGLAAASSIWLVIMGCSLIACVAGLAMSRSRSGVLLAIVALIGVVAMALRRRPESRRGPKKTKRIGAIVAVAAFGIIFAAQFGLTRLLTRLDQDPLADLRVALNQTTFSAALKALPFGTGLGSFVPVYATVERDKDIFAGFANRAHDDYAELFLETGLVGAIAVAAFFLWFGGRAFSIWRRESPHGRKADLLFRSSTIIVAILLMQSVVEYPLRTTALSAVFAFFCGALFEPARGREFSPEN